MVDSTLIPLTLTFLNSGSVITTADSKPTQPFVQNYNNALSNILASFSALADQSADNAAILQQLVDLSGFVVDINGKLDNATITSSYTVPTMVLTASTTGTPGTTSQIVVADHQRVYTDGATRNVTGATITGLTPDTAYYVHYMDPGRIGGIVTYLVSTDPQDVAQVGGNHSVGAALTPVDAASGENTGGGDPGPGVPSHPTCVDIESFMPYDLIAKHLQVESPLMLLDETTMDGVYVGYVDKIKFVNAPCLRLRTESGITLVASMSTPITTREGVIDIRNCFGVEVPVMDHGEFAWEKIVSLDFIGARMVAWIEAGNGTYAAGEQDGRYILTHNKTVDGDTGDL